MSIIPLSFSSWTVTDMTPLLSNCLQMLCIDPTTSQTQGVQINEGPLYIDWGTWSGLGQMPNTTTQFIVYNQCHARNVQIAEMGVNTL